MNDLRMEILQKRLERILDEYPNAGASRQSELVKEAMLIYRDIRAASSPVAQSGDRQAAS